MSPSRLRKRIARALMVSWREQPTRYDIEALQENIRRVGLVIQIRWALLIVLVTYSAFGGLAYASRMQPGELASRMTIPALALFVVVLYNTFYQLNYKRLGNIAVWNQGQLALDALVVTLLVYYSGGVNSWFWSMYSLFILEAAFILPRRRAAWLLTLGCVTLLGTLYMVELFHLVPHVAMPFEAPHLFDDPVFIAVRFGWQVAVLAGTAAVSTQLVWSARSDTATRQQLVVLDDATGLYSRAYFMRALTAEVARAGRDTRQLHVLLVDIDHFGDFNKQFGIELGDRLLRSIADTITEIVGEAGDTLVTSNVAARFGGEEFVVLLAEDVASAGSPQREDATRLGELLRAGIARTTVENAGVTVSIGVASYPADGATPEQLLDAADAALSQAIEEGGDRVDASVLLDTEELEAEVGAEDYRDSLEL